jgi:hypothetical protein
MSAAAGQWWPQPPWPGQDEDSVANRWNSAKPVPDEDVQVLLHQLSGSTAAYTAESLTPETVDLAADAALALLAWLPEGRRLDVLRAAAPLPPPLPAGEREFECCCWELPEGTLRANLCAEGMRTHKLVIDPTTLANTLGKSLHINDRSLWKHVNCAGSDPSGDPCPAEKFFLDDACFAAQNWKRAGSSKGPVKRYCPKCR